MDYSAWMPALNTRVDLTLKQADMLCAGDERKGRCAVRLTEDLVYRSVTRMMNRLGDLVLGRSARPARLDALIWLERGCMGRRWHLHGLFERPPHITQSQFAELVPQAWLRQPFAHKEMRIEPARDVMACLRYNAKGSDRLENVVYQHHEDDLVAIWRRPVLSDITDGEGEGTPITNASDVEA